MIIDELNEGCLLGWGLGISGFTLGVQVLITTPGLVEQSHYNQLYIELFIAYLLPKVTTRKLWFTKYAQFDVEV